MPERANIQSPCNKKSGAVRKRKKRSVHPGGLHFTICFFRTKTAADSAEIKPSAAVLVVAEKSMLSPGRELGIYLGQTGFGAKKARRKRLAPEVGEVLCLRR